MVWKYKSRFFLFIGAAVILSLLSPAGDAYASSGSDTLKKQIEYQSGEKDKKADGSFQKEIEEEGKTWALKNITYKVISEEPVMTSEPVTEVVKSSPVKKGEAYHPESGIEKDGIIYNLTETEKSDVVIEKGYSQKISGFSEYDSEEEAKNAPKTKVVTTRDRRTGENVTLECSLEGITKQAADHWEDTYINIKFISYDADTFVWNGITVSKNVKNPLKGYEKELLKSVGGSEKTHQIKSIRWKGKAYRNSKGILCRNARADVKKRTSHWRVTYTGTRVVEDTKGTVYTSVYAGMREVNSGKFLYTIRAVGEYEEKAGFPVLGITLGLLFVILIVVGIIFILKKKRMSNKTE